MQELTKLLQAQFDRMCKTGKLFRVAVTGQQVWDAYLAGFTNEQDPVFRDPNSTSHNCNNCNNFIRRYGNIVAFDDELNIMTIFDVECDEEYYDTISGLSSKLSAAPIKDVFFETLAELNSLPYEVVKPTQDKYLLGLLSNHKRYTKEEAEMYGVVKPDEIRTFHHMALTLPTAYVDKTGASVEAIMGKYRSDKEVFQRSMEEIPTDTLELVSDLIIQGSLLNGDAHLSKVKTMLAMKKAYDTIPSGKRDNWCWENSYNFSLAKFKNELIGVLCTELSEGKEINAACLAWNKRVDPANYMKAVAPITEAQKKNAHLFVVEAGYEASFDRRLATLDDIKVTEIKHINNDTGKTKGVSIFDNVKTIKSQHKRNEFDKVEEVSIEKFMKDILPGCTSVELYLENRLENNMVTMTTSKETEVKSLFKWDNPYSWTYKGNLAGKSMIKEGVKGRGGNVDGVLRFSISWSPGESKDNSDLDAHCIEPSGNEIYFGNSKNMTTGGFLDVDITRPLSEKAINKAVVENIAYPTLNKMEDGEYKFYTHNFANRGSEGFTAEIEVAGEIHEYNFPQPVKQPIHVATVTLKSGVFSIKHMLPSSSSSKEVYGLETNNFHKVSLVCLSPNHWGENEAGNKHYFFMLDNCKIDAPVRGFHNENLNTELLEHRKVLDILGAFTMLDSPVKNQLSGVGFNATVKDEVILKLGGNFKRVVKVKF